MASALEKRLQQFEETLRGDDYVSLPRNWPPSKQYTYYLHYIQKFKIPISCLYCQEDVLPEDYPYHCDKKHGTLSFRQCVWCRRHFVGKTGEDMMAHVFQCTQKVLYHPALSELMTRDNDCDVLIPDDDPSPEYHPSYTSRYFGIPDVVCSDCTKLPRIERVIDKMGSTL